MSDDYYSILGLKKDATEAQIKKAYKKMAVKYHPDKQGGKTDAEKKKAEEMFKRVAEAYEVLSDPDKRSTYDRFGKDGLNAGPMPQGAHFSNQNAFKIFEQFFGGSSGFSGFGPGTFRFSTSNGDFEDMSTFNAQPMNFNMGNMGGMNMRGMNSGRGNSRRPRRQKGPDHNLEYGVLLADFYNGRTRKIKIDYSIGSDRRSDVVELDIQKGWRPGVKLTFNGKSSCQDGEIPGDLIVELVQKPIQPDRSGNIHYEFMRRIDVSPHLYAGVNKPDSIKYADLVCTIPIRLTEAQSGGTKQITHLDGRTIDVKFPRVERSMQEIKIRNEGMPIRRKGKIVGNGDLYVRFDIYLSDAV